MGNDIKAFSLAALELLSVSDEDKEAMDRMRKILSEPIYIFNDRVKVVDGKVVATPDHIADDFFGKNITVQALVGKNGSGKSSILDLVYRVLNNLGYTISEILRPIRQYNPENIANGIEPEFNNNWEEERISYVEGLHARLYFTVGEELSWIECKGCDIKIFAGEEYHINNPFDHEDVKLVDVISKCFYAIVTNYSVQSFVSRDYEEEFCHTFIDQYDKDSQIVVRKSISGSDFNWIDGVFHKNDGYLSPIVLNPFRYHGHIDMEREEDLTIERLTSLLLWNKNVADIHLLNDYKCESITFSLDLEKIYNKYKSAEKERANRYAKNKELEAIRKSKQPATTQLNEEDTLGAYLKAIYANDRSSRWVTYDDLAMDFYGDVQSDDADCIAKEILECFGVLNQTKLGIKVWGAMYLVYKTLNIAGTYDGYSDFRSLGHLAKFYDKPTEEQRKLIFNLCSTILKDNSHIAVKLKQVLHFMHFDLKEEKRLKSDFSYDTYLEVLGHKKHPDYANMKLQLPPAIFKAKIKMTDGKQMADLFSLSSGERQMIFTTSTFVYHIYNLLSIKDVNRVRYRNISMILDEVEICFHPELQKSLLWNLIKMLESFGINEVCAINIIIATHSPFILSDIPQPNILYLDRGKTYTAKAITVNPFAANVNEILSQSFFLSNGFMGEFVREKIKDLINYLQGEKIRGAWDDKKALAVINQIGDPLIVQSLLSIRNLHTQKEEDKILEWHKEQIRLIEERRNNNA